MPKSRSQHKTRAPEVLVRSAKPKPSAVYESYWRFAYERHEVYRRRLHDPAGPWTDDPIITRYRFTNAYRAADRVSQYLIRKVIYKGCQSPREVFFRTLLFKFFNKTSTWDVLCARFGFPTVDGFDVTRYGRALTDERSRGPIYSAAYIIPSPQLGAKWKHCNHLRLLRSMLDANLPEKLAEAQSLAAVYEMLLAFPSMGPFLAFQFTIDLNYGPLLNFSEMDFVVPGPGARDGIRKCFSSLGDYSATDTIRLVTETQEAEFRKRGLPFRGLFGRPLQLIDCQNLFCEVDKYARVAHPEAQGVSGRTRIKQQFRPLGTIDEPMFPAKWKVNTGASSQEVGIASPAQSGQGTLAFEPPSPRGSSPRGAPSPSSTL